MEDDEWNGKKEEIWAWFDANPDYNSKRKLADMLFSLGDVARGFRNRHWGSITSVLATVPNSPIPEPEMFGFTCSCCDGYFESQVEKQRYCEDCQTCQRCNLDIGVSVTHCQNYALIHGSKLSGVAPNWAHSALHYCKECEGKWKIRVEERNPEDAELGWVIGLSEISKYSKHHRIKEFFERL